MGKKAKKKTRNNQKEKPVSSASPKAIPPNLNPSDKVGGTGVVVNERKKCAHLCKGVDLDRISLKIGSVESVRCQDCREDAVDRRSGKGKSKAGKKKGTGHMDAKSDSKSIWVCMKCGHFACGGIGLPTTPQSHAAKHARQYLHHCVIQFENPQLCWCFPCNSLIPVERSEDNGEQKHILLDVAKLIKGRSSASAAVDVEDAWFGGGGSTENRTVSDNAGSGILDGSYRVKGLINLGNTCFFNSVMQNLFAIGMLKDYFRMLDWSAGPLTMALKKLFSEISLEVDSGNVINPKSFFGCICVKAPQFRGYQQQDSHELLRCLLDGLCTEELGARKLQNSSGEDGTTSDHGPTFVDAIFGGQLSSTVCCVECGHSSVVYEPFLDLSLPVPTKKSPPKKAPTVSRSRKPKLQPKKGGKTRLKESNNFTPTSSKHEPDPGPSKSNGSSSLVPTSVPVAEQSVASVDDSSFSWMDYIGTGNESEFLVSVPLNQDISDAQDFGDKQVCKDVAEQIAGPSDDVSLLGYAQPVELDAECHLVSQNYGTSAIQDSESKQVIQNGILQDSSEFLSQGCSPNRESKLDFYSSQGNSCEDELPLQVQSSEVVLLLPYKEENLTAEEIVRKEGEPSTSLARCEPDGVDFDGFGDLFNEPEMVPDPNTKSWSGDMSIQFQASEISQTSFVAGNTSESDPDEVDNTDAPASIDSCLSYFTKPELLSDKLAWHCENCSKILQGKRTEGKGVLQKTTLRTGINGVKVRSGNVPLGFNKDSLYLTECSHLDNGKLENNNFSTTAESLPLNNKRLDDSNHNCTKLENCQKGEETDSEIVNPISNCLDCLKISQGDKELGLLNHTTQEQTPTSDHHDSSIQTSDSCNLDEYTRIQCKTVQAKPKVSQLSARVCDSDENGDGKLDSKNVKVMRDATKRMLINRLPPILTIHLKRFSQDSRGRLSKLSGHVSFKETIDLRPYMDPRSREERDKCEYHLVGVVEHSGTMRGGHYIAYVRGNKSRGSTEQFSVESTWYYTSDSHVREVSLAEVLRCEAYILFYEKI